MSEPYDPLLTQIMPRFVILNFRKFFFSQEKRVPQHRECMKYKCEKFCTQVRYDGEICSSDVNTHKAHLLLKSTCIYCTLKLLLSEFITKTCTFNLLHVS